MAASSSAVASATKKGLSTVLKSNDMKWAAGGWIFFVAENAILSENRTYLIANMGDDKYHLVYGTLSTIATASIGYSYYRLNRQQSSLSSKQAAMAAMRRIPRSPVALGGSWMLLTIGLSMATQALPKFQIPVAIGNSDSGSGSMVQVRCPFDFKEPNRDDNDTSPYGLDRITRHPGLWALGITGLGQALLLHPAASTASIPLKVWWTGPALVAWLGGSHTDSRFRRGMGGTLDPVWDSQTSNIPFAAMITGRQGNVGTSFSKLFTEEIKPLNAVIATTASTVWVVMKARRFRIR